MIKALMVVTFMSGAEYAVDMPSMNSCLENAKVVMEQSEMVEAICIPRADTSAKMKDMFTMFGDMVERLQENELGTSYSKCGDGARQLYTN
jgi:hypothetical protein